MLSSIFICDSCHEATNNQRHAPRQISFSRRPSHVLFLCQIKWSWCLKEHQTSQKDVSSLTVTDCVTVKAEKETHIHRSHNIWMSQMSVSCGFTLALESLLSKPPVKTKKAELNSCLRSPLSHSHIYAVNLFIHTFIHTRDTALRNVHQSIQIFRHSRHLLSSTSTKTIK